MKYLKLFEETVSWKLDDIDTFRSRERIVIPSEDLRRMTKEKLEQFLNDALVGNVATFSALTKDSEGKLSVGRAGNWWIDKIDVQEELEHHSIMTDTRLKPTVYITGHGYYQNASNSYTMKLYIRDDIEYIKYKKDREFSDWDPFGEDS